MQGPLNFRWMFWHDGWSHDLAPSGWIALKVERVSLFTAVKARKNSGWNEYYRKTGG
jgi:hypothetical protein